VESWRQAEGGGGGGEEAQFREVRGACSRSKGNHAVTGGGVHAAGEGEKRDSDEGEPEEGAVTRIYSNSQRTHSPQEERWTGRE
jgi:hypothetical protein